METKIISHRGRTSRKSVDNTLESINNAIDLNVDMVEVDIRRTKDSQIVCFHDPDIDDNFLRDLDYSEISGKGKGMLFLVASGTAVKFK